MTADSHFHLVQIHWSFILLHDALLSVFSPGVLPWTDTHDFGEMACQSCEMHKVFTNPLLAWFWVLLTAALQTVQNHQDTSYLLMIGLWFMDRGVT